MAVPRDQLLPVLSIARDHSSLRGGRGLSLRQLIEESRYCDLRPKIEASDLEDVLRTEPQLVEDWLAYSEDKRTSGGWAFGPSHNEGWTVYVPGGEPKSFAASAAACAEYVLRELDFWAAIGAAG